MSEGKFGPSQAVLAFSLTLVLILIACGLYFLSPSMIGEKIRATSVQLSLEVNIGEIIGALLIGTASLVAAAVYALRGHRVTPGAITGGGGGGESPRPAGGSPAATEEIKAAQGQATDAVNKAKEQAETQMRAATDEMIADAKRQLDDMVAGARQELLAFQKRREALWNAGGRINFDAGSINLEIPSDTKP